MCTVGEVSKRGSYFWSWDFGFSYVRRREQSGIVGRYGHHGVIAAQLIELPVYQLHEYVRILFESRTKGPARVLWLWRWAVDLPYSFSQFLL